MWPFSKPESKTKEWLALKQAREVTRIFYADHDSNCWYACALLAGHDGVRIATSSKEEAIELASTLAGEVLAKTGKRISIAEGP